MLMEDVDDSADQPLPSRRRTLHGARHGGIMDALEAGDALDTVAQRARVAAAPLMRHYRAHSIGSDVFETNGRFSEVKSDLVASRAERHGLLTDGPAVDRELRAAVEPLMV
jgi:hypothetical protein